MCGISAFIAFQDHSLEAKYIELMNNQIRHRGPDDEGYYLIDTEDNDCILAGNDSIPHNQSISYSPYLQINQYYNKKIKLALGHRRLSIVDLSAHGHQPLSINNGNYWIAFNGEVYNFIELRKELENFGYTFSSQSDTEVILSAYKQWGVACLHKFNGMFAIIIYDKLNNKVFIARDRFGIKPLYYYIDDNGIFFASEIKQFTELASWNPHLNHQIAHDFLVYGLSDHSSETMFCEVRQLRGGEATTIKLNKFFGQSDLKISRWYNFDVRENPNINYREACKQFQEKFIDAVKLRLRADVKVGSCLSGGLDSSSIVSVMARLLAEQKALSLLNTFSACSKHKEFDEKEYIDVVVKDSRVNAFYCYPDLDKLFELNETVTWHQDEPFGSTSIFAQWSVFELAKEQQTTVILDGQGADEQLAGYQGLYFQIYFNELLKSGQLIKYANELYNFRKLHNINTIKTILKSILALFPPQIKQLVGKLLGKGIYTNNWLNSKFLIFSSTNPYIKNGLNNCNVKETLYSQIMYNNLSMLLHWEDRDSMAHSIESRVPFLDYRLVEFLFSLPSNYKIKGGVTKRILRDGLQGILPDKIRNRMSKLGFATPEEIWVKQNSGLFKDKLIEAIDSCPYIFNKTKVMATFEDIIANKRPFDFWLWRVISFGTWCKLFKINI
ncbi:asparagine synthase (glutamine-hydrolyzing) [Aquella oligotrophica]|uniref:asparagine synthase (glutamine-hydrolyzing) n=1 Tax=Aquella oligotrophica TaxID=2067065 RepID=A0A2I7N999_9NEIS|nr:asparagine synthase (glutamine-hydrolyzing) [Aquella oligotrophica]AUR53030.1 asparagine synthase (glutamine-hydrolyzing) [Aquella oligotrophica]